MTLQKPGAKTYIKLPRKTKAEEPKPEPAKVAEPAPEPTSPFEDAFAPPFVKKWAAIMRSPEVQAMTPMEQISGGLSLLITVVAAGGVDPAHVDFLFHEAMDTAVALRARTGTPDGTPPAEA